MRDDYIKYRNALYDIFNTEAGKIVITELQNSFVKNSVMDFQESTDKVMYRLGQKEFVQTLIEDALTNPEELEHKFGGNV